MSVLFDWRIQDIERKANNAAPIHEVSALRELVVDMERSIRELKSEVNELRAQLFTVQNAEIQLMQAEIARINTDMEARA